MLKLINNFRKDEDGASLIEYSLLIGLITVAVVALISGVGVTLVGFWNALTAALAG